MVILPGANSDSFCVILEQLEQSESLKLEHLEQFRTIIIIRIRYKKGEEMKASGVILNDQGRRPSGLPHVA